MKLPPLFNDRLFFRGLFTLAVPIMLQNLVNSMVNLLATIMVGRLGTVEIAAVGLGFQVFFLYQLFLFGIISGGSIFTAQFWGKGDIAGIRKNLGFCITLSSVWAVLFTLAAMFVPEKLIGFYSMDEAVIKAGADYLRILSFSFFPFALSFAFVLTLRSVEKVRLAFVTTVITLFINVLLSYLFIFGKGSIPAMGIKGAAMATVISRLFEAVIIITVSYAKKYVIAGSIREFLSFNRNYARHFFRISLPVILNEIFWSTGVTMQSVIFARTNTDAIAAFNIINTVSMITWVLFLGLGHGVGVMIGKKIGEGDEKTARDYASRIARFVPLLAVGAALILFPLSRLLPFVFKVNSETLAVASQMFIVLCCVYPFRAFNMAMIIGICRAGGDTVFCVFYDLGTLWLIGLPLAALAAFVMHAPVWLIYLCIITEDPFKAILGIWRLKSGKWLHNVTFHSS